MGFTANVRKALPGLFTPARTPTVDHASQWQLIVDSYLEAFANGNIGDALGIAAVYRARQMNASTVAALNIVTSGGQSIPAPNRFQTWQTFLTEMILAMQDHGDAYIYVTPEDSLSVLPNDQVTVNWNVGETVRIYTRTGNGVRFREDPNSQFRNLYVVSMNRAAGDLTGIGPMESPRIATALAAQKYATEFFLNNAQPTGMLTVPAPLNDVEAGRLKAQWLENHSVRSPAVLSGGIDYRPLSFNMTDSQWVEGHLVDIGDVASLFGVPSHFLSYAPQGSSVTYANRESLYRDYWLQTLWPLYGSQALHMISDVWKIPATELAFDTESLFMPSLQERSQAASVLVAAGYDPAGVADVTGLPPIASVARIEVEPQ